MVRHDEPSGLVLYASLPHYAEHLAPLAVELGGTLYCDSADATASRALSACLALDPTSLDQHGAWRVVPGAPPDGHTPAVVASYRDRCRLPGERRFALLEHGAGQGYRECPHDPHYAGGDEWGGARLIMAPGPHSARKWNARYNGVVPVVELGGSPRLDRYVVHVKDGTGRPCGDYAIAPYATDATPLAVSFHWGATVSPEAGSAWAYWQPAIAELARTRPVLGTAHPKLWPSMHMWYEREGIPSTPSFTDLLDSCWLYLCDNSSTMYEWAGLGRPVLGLPHPEWRRDIEHGLRFWEHRPGPDTYIGTSDPQALARAVVAWMERPDGQAMGEELREAACLEAYGMARFDGRATERAVAAIEEHLL